MVEVVGTAPTSAMFITKFVYRRSWKTNMNNIKHYFTDSMKKFLVNHKIIVLFLLISFFWLVAVLGIENISFQSIKWLHNGSDAALHQSGWYFFQNDIWRFPLGSNPNYGISFGSSIVFTDSIPLFALIFKSLKFIIPENFQYFSLWYFITFYLQLFFSFKIFKKFTNSDSYSFIGSLLILITPFFMYRVGWHASVSAHWILLFTLYLGITHNINKSKLSWLLLVILSSLISYSFTFMVLVFYSLLRFFNFIFYKKNFVEIIKDFILIIICLLITLYVVGYFQVRMLDTLGIGFGVYKFNLLHIFDPTVSTRNVSFSWILPDIKLSRGEEVEGYNYLGLGNIIMMLIAIGLFIKKKYDKKILFSESGRDIKIVFLITIFFTFWALSNKISFGSLTLIEIPLNKYIYAMLSVAKNTGRMFWIVNYFIIIMSILIIYKFFDKKKSLIILLSIFFIQLIDGSAAINSRFGSIKPFNVGPELNEEFWGKLLTKYEIVKTTYPVSWSPLFSSFSYLMEKNNTKKTSLVVQARSNRKAVADARYKLYQDLTQKKLDPNTVYIVDNLGHLKHLKHLYKEENVGFFLSDNFWAMVANDRNKMIDKDIKEFNNVELKLLNVDKKENLSFNNKDSYYGFGWSHNLGNQGIWSDGYQSTLLFKTEKNQDDLKLEVFYLPYITKKNSILEFDIYVNNLFNKKMKLTKENNEEKFEIIIKGDFIENNEVKVDFNFKNPMSPYEVLESPDSRKLGILVKNIKISQI